MNKLNKKGFTLIELLGTIIVIAVVTTIGVFSITGIIANIRKRTLATEGIQAVEAAKAAFYDAKISNVFRSNTTVCYSLEWLCKNNYYDKGCNGGNAGDKYSGSVMIKTVNNDLQYRFWISNAAYSFGSNDGGWNNGINPMDYNIEKVYTTTSLLNGISDCGTDITFKYKNNIENHRCDMEYSCSTDGKLYSTCNGVRMDTGDTCTKVCENYGTCSTSCGPGTKSRTCHYYYQTDNQYNSDDFTESSDCGNPACCSEGTYQYDHCSNNGYKVYSRFNGCTNRKEEETRNEACRTQTMCSEWSECVKARKTRTCTYYEGGEQKNDETYTTMSTEGCCTAVDKMMYASCTAYHVTNICGNTCKYDKKNNVRNAGEISCNNLVESYPSNCIINFTCDAKYYDREKNTYYVRLSDSSDYRCEFNKVETGAKRCVSNPNYEDGIITNIGSTSNTSYPTSCSAQRFVIDVSTVKQGDASALYIYFNGKYDKDQIGNKASWYAVRCDSGKYSGKVCLYTEICIRQCGTSNASCQKTCSCAAGSYYSYTNTECY